MLLWANLTDFSPRLHLYHLSSLFPFCLYCLTIERKENKKSKKEQKQSTETETKDLSNHPTSLEKKRKKKDGQSYRMEVQWIDWVYLVALSVTLEGKVFTLLCLIQMMYTNPPFNRANLIIDNIIKMITLIIDDDSYRVKGKRQYPVLHMKLTNLNM